MVLEMKVPHSANPEALKELVPVFGSYVLSFIYVGIYWSNHHHIASRLHTGDRAILWANLHLLFWLSLLPFVTGWMGENHFAAMPSALYGCVLFAAAIAYAILQRTIIHEQGPNSRLKVTGRQRLEGQALAAAVSARNHFRLLFRSRRRRCCMFWERSCGWCPIAELERYLSHDGE